MRDYYWLKTIKEGILKAKHVSGRVRRDHPRCRIATYTCVYGYTSDVVIYSNFQVLLKSVNGFRGPGGGVENWLFPLLRLLTFAVTACTTA